MRYQPQYHTACQIQKMILGKMGLELAQANQVPKMGKIKTDLTPSELCSLTKAWSELEDRKRILRNKGLPKAVEVSDKKPKVQRAVFTE